MKKPELTLKAAFYLHGEEVYCGAEKIVAKERALNKFGNWRRIIVRLQGVTTGA